MSIKCCSFRRMADEIIKHNKKIIMFGAGVIGQITTPEILRRYGVLSYLECYLDNDHNKCGEVIEIDGRKYEIKEPEYLKGCNKNRVVLINISRFDEVKIQMEHMAVIEKLDIYIMPMMCIHNMCSGRSGGMAVKKDEALIPKKIHYMWIGKKEIPDNLKKCMDSWKKYCPDYEIIEWNESNYDIWKHPYMRQAYERGAYGFVPDYARLDILYSHGGFYMDTDVELIKSLDAMRYQEVFCGVEKWQVLNFGGCSGAVKGHPMMKSFLDARENIFFVDENGNQNRSTCGFYDTKLILERGYRTDGTTQTVDGMNIYAYDYFHPYDYMSGLLHVTENTYSIHHFNGGWLDEKMKEQNDLTAKKYLRLYKECLAEHENNKMSMYEKIIARKEKISLIGLGYVGMPIAVAFSKKADVIGFDLNEKKIRLYKSGVDPTNEVGNETIINCTVDFTSDETRLREAKFHIVAVPTPVNADHTPDLSPVESASRILGRNLTKGSIVVYESTVYPGVTEDICVPILEEESGLKCGADFKVGYSPERINPGDKNHRLENIKKIVSGMDQDTCGVIKKVYDLVIEAGTYPVSNIKTAEAIKVVENSQRDINIAFMNELAMVFDRMGIDTNEVVDGMNTKWNALGFRPGLVGGHCIGVDPYYFTYEAEKLGYHSQIILNGRIVNDGMGAYIAETVVKKMVEAGQAPRKSKIVILGLTFKEDCPDIRNSKVIDIVRKLNEYGIEPDIVDPWADDAEAYQEYGVHLSKITDIHHADCIVAAVAHRQFRKNGLQALQELFGGFSSKKVLIDVKGVYNREDLKLSNLNWWRL